MGTSDQEKLCKYANDAAHGLTALFHHTIGKSGERAVADAILDLSEERAVLECTATFSPNEAVIRGKLVYRNGHREPVFESWVTAPVQC
jgi:hypothetical protein